MAQARAGMQGNGHRELLDEKKREKGPAAEMVAVAPAAALDLKRQPPAINLPGMPQAELANSGVAQVQPAGPAALDLKDRPPPLPLIALPPDRKQDVAGASSTGQPFPYWQANDKAKAWQKNFNVLAHNAIEASDSELFQFIMGHGHELDDSVLCLERLAASDAPWGTPEFKNSVIREVSEAGRERCYRDWAIGYLTRLVQLQNIFAYELCLMTDETKIEKGKLYVREKQIGQEGKEIPILAYSVITPAGEIVKDELIPVQNLVPRPFTLELLTPLLPNILQFTSGNQHTWKKDYTFDALYHAVQGMQRAEQVEERKRVTITRGQAAHPGGQSPGQEARQFLRATLPAGFTAGTAYHGIDSFWDSIAQEFSHLNFMLFREGESPCLPTVQTLRKLAGKVLAEKKVAGNVEKFRKVLQVVAEQDPNNDVVRTPCQSDTLHLFIRKVLDGIFNAHLKKKRIPQYLWVCYTNLMIIIAGCEDEHFRRTIFIDHSIFFSRYDGQLTAEEKASVQPFIDANTLVWSYADYKHYKANEPRAEDLKQGPPPPQPPIPPMTINGGRIPLPEARVISDDEKELFPEEVMRNALLICEGVSAETGAAVRLHVAKYGAYPGGASSLFHYFFDGKKVWEEDDEEKVKASYQDVNVIHVACHAGTFQFIPLHSTPANAQREVVVREDEKQVVAQPVSPRRDEGTIAAMVDTMIRLKIGECMLDGVRDLRYECTLLHIAMKKYWFIFAFHPTSIFDSSLKEEKLARLSSLNTIIEICIYRGINYYGQAKINNSRLTPFAYAESKVVAAQAGKAAPQIDIGVLLNWLECSLLAMHHFTDLSKRVGASVMAYLPSVREKQASFFSIVYHRKLRKERIPKLELLVGSLYEAAYFRSDFNLKGMLDYLQTRGDITDGVIHASGLRLMIDGINAEVKAGDLQVYNAMPPIELILRENTMVAQREGEQAALRFMASGEGIKAREEKQALLEAGRAEAARADREAEARRAAQEEKRVEAARADRAQEEKRAEAARADRAQEEKRAEAARADRAQEEKRVEAARADQAQEENRVAQIELRRLRALLGMQMPEARPVIHVDLRVPAVADARATAAAADAKTNPPNNPMAMALGARPAAAAAPLAIPPQPGSGAPPRAAAAGAVLTAAPQIMFPAPQPINRAPGRAQQQQPQPGAQRQSRTVVPL